MFLFAGTLQRHCTAKDGLASKLWVRRNECSLLSERASLQGHNQRLIERCGITKGSTCPGLAEYPVRSFKEETQALDELLVLELIEFCHCDHRYHPTRSSSRDKESHTVNARRLCTPLQHAPQLRRNQV